MTSKMLYESLKTKPFSYGEFLATILEHNGRSISHLPNEDFVFPDNSVIRLTNNTVQLLEFLQE